MKRVDPELLRRRRQRKRRGLTLQDRAITVQTRIRYFVAVSQIIKPLERTSLDIDDFLVDWIDRQYQLGASITSVADALSGLHHYLPWSRGKIRSAWKLYGLRRKIERPRQAPPLPMEVVEGLAGRCICQENLRLALCLCLGFWGLLRTGEIFKLRLRHLLIQGHTMIVRLGETKTGTRRQVDENVVVRHVPTILIAQTVLDLAGSRNDFVWPLPQRDFRQQFKHLCSFFKLKGSFRPYSLRRGGATEDFRQHGLMEKSLLKGRWGTSAAARQYIQEGLSMLTKLTLSPHTRRP